MTYFYKISTNFSEGYSKNEKYVIELAKDASILRSKLHQEFLKINY